MNALPTAMSVFTSANLCWMDWKRKEDDGGGGDDNEEEDENDDDDDGDEDDGYYDGDDDDGQHHQLPSTSRSSNYKHPLTTPKTSNGTTKH